MGRFVPRHSTEISLCVRERVRERRHASSIPIRNRCPSVRPNLELIVAPFSLFRGFEGDRFLFFFPSRHSSAAFFREVR